MGSDRVNYFELDCKSVQRSWLLCDVCISISGNHARSKVLDSLEKSHVAQVKPFALHEKYVPAVLARKADGKGGDEDDNSDDDDDEKPKPKSQKPQKPKKKAEKTDWQYGEIRTLYIQSKKNSGLSYKDAVNLWDNSVEKAQLLALVPLPELRKRRFVGKGVVENPWLKKAKEADQAWTRPGYFHVH